MSVGKLVATVVLGGALVGAGVTGAGTAFAVTPTAEAPTPPAQGNATFEDLLANAETAPTADALAAPFAEDCERARREIDRARCRGTQSFLRAKLPRKLLHTVVDSTRVVSVSAFDAGVRGFRVRVVGCLTCDEPAKAPDGEERYLTLAVPGKQAESLREGVIVGESRVNFASPEEARAFELKVKPHLRAEFLFRGNGTPWTARNEKGVAFTPVAMRVFDRCTGEVLYSQPRSAARVDVVEGLAGCGDEPVAARETSSPRKKDEGTEEAPEKLGARELGDALKASMPAVAACDAEFRTTGSVELEFDLGGQGGTAQAVRAKGNLGGTPVANCLAQAVRSVQFPRFQAARQTFSYSVRLDGK
jgi:hypothetical protein